MNVSRHASRAGHSPRTRENGCRYCEGHAPRSCAGQIDGYVDCRSAGIWVDGYRLARMGRPRSRRTLLPGGALFCQVSLLLAVHEIDAKDRAKQQRQERGADETSPRTARKRAVTRFEPPSPTRNPSARRASGDAVAAPDPRSLFTSAAKERPNGKDSTEETLSAVPRHRPPDVGARALWATKKRGDAGAW